MSNFSTEILKSLYLDEEKFKLLMRKEIENAVNELLKAEIGAFLGYEKYDFAGWNTWNSRNGSYTRIVHSQFGDLNLVIPRD